MLCNDDKNDLFSNSKKKSRRTTAVEQEYGWLKTYWLIQI
jgi:hypothetical protein